jgi:hypothetical protein
MRAIHIANAARRDAEVGFESPARPSRVRYVLPDGTDPAHVKYLKTTADLDQLTAEFGDLVGVGRAIVAGDPDVDIELVGKYITRTHQLYLTEAGAIAYRVSFQQVVYRPDGTEQERRDLTKATANVAGELPIVWSGRKFPKADALRRFVFTRHYQLRHDSGLTYDFLYAMAKELAEADALMLVGAGPKGAGPIILQAGGDPYRGFLEGRIDGDRYLLILHLTNLELKPLPTGEDAA